MAPVLCTVQISAKVPLFWLSTLPSKLWNTFGAFTIKPVTPLNTSGLALSAMLSASLLNFSSMACPRAR